MTEENEEKMDAAGNEVEDLDYFGEEPEETSKPRDLKRPLIIGVIALAALLLLGLFLFLRGRNAAESESESKEAPVVSVKVTQAEKDSISSDVSAPGTVTPAEQSTVSSTISAQIIQMQLLKNAVVHKGDILAVLASQDLRAQRDEAEAALNEAKLNLETLEKVTIPQTSAQMEHDISDAKANMDNTRATYERRSELYRKGGISLKEVEASQLAYTNAQNAYRLILQNSNLNKTAVNPNARSIAQAKIKQAQDHLNAIQVQANFAQVKAPITGIVTDQFQFEGEFASSGAKLLTISDISEVIVKAQFADTVVSTLKAGDAVSVFPENAPDEQMTGKVTLISRSSDPQNRTVEVWARFGNPQGLLIAGGAARFVVTNQTVDDAIVIPLSAITLNASNSDSGTVMTVSSDSVAHETKVKIGIKEGDKVQVVDGLNGGETVVIEGNYALPDGTKVEIAKDDALEKEDK
jgi:HlyD family secretion protein